MSGDDYCLEASTINLAGSSLTVLGGGQGRNVLVLHDEWGIRGNEQIWSMLADKAEVLAPIAPGFMGSPSSESIQGVHDLALLYNLLLRELGADQTVIVGISFGAWIAAEMAVMNEHPLAGLVLVGPVGLRFGGPTVRNFIDLFAQSDQELASLLYRDQANARSVTPESPEDEIYAYAHNREATARYCWEPYLHTPGLERWTRELRLPVSVIHGSEDRFVMDGYFEMYAESFAHATRMEVPNTGHFPHLESPSTVSDAILHMLV